MLHEKVVEKFLLLAPVLVHGDVNPSAYRAVRPTQHEVSHSPDLGERSEKLNAKARNSQQQVHDVDAFRSTRLLHPQQLCVRHPDPEERVQHELVPGVRVRRAAVDKVPLDSSCDQQEQEAW